MRFAGRRAVGSLILISRLLERRQLFRSVAFSLTADIVERGAVYTDFFDSSH